MIEKLRKVSNPLTVVAVFATLAEVSGTIVLPNVAGQVQQFFVWFVMLFPVLLVILFFLTLNYNHRVLYAPSDFQDDENFLALFREPTPAERLRKLSSERREQFLVIGSEETEAKEPSGERTPAEQAGEGGNQIVGGHPTDAKDISSQGNDSYGVPDDIITVDSMETRQFIKFLVVDQLAKELDIDDLQMERQYRDNIYDAVGYSCGKLYLIEVGVLHSVSSASLFKYSKLGKMSDSLDSLPEHVKPMIRLIVAIAIDTNEAPSQERIREIESMDTFNGFPLSVKVFHVPDLLRRNPLS